MRTTQTPKPVPLRVIQKYRFQNLPVPNTYNGLPDTQSDTALPPAWGSKDYQNQQPPHR